MRPAPPENWIVAPAPAIVTPELWQLANDALDSGKARSTRNAKSFFLLRGLITCLCGRKLGGHTDTAGRRYYRCPTRAGRAWFDTCPATSYYPAEWLEEAVWQAVTGPLHDHELMRAAIAEQRQRLQDERGQIEDRLRAVETTLADVQRRLSQLGTLEFPDEATLLEAIRQDVALGAQEATQAERRALLELLRVKLAVIDRERIRVEWLLDEFVYTSSRGSGGARSRWSCRTRWDTRTPASSRRSAPACAGSGLATRSSCTR